jgi:hypothetical protein
VNCQKRLLLLKLEPMHVPTTGANEAPRSAEDRGLLPDRPKSVLDNMAAGITARFSRA